MVADDGWERILVSARRESGTVIIKPGDRLLAVELGRERRTRRGICWNWFDHVVCSLDLISPLQVGMLISWLSACPLETIHPALMSSHTHAKKSTS